MVRNYNKRENDLAIQAAKFQNENQQLKQLIAATNNPDLLNQSNIINRQTRPDLYPDTNTNTNPENIPGEIIDPIQLTIPGLEGARNPLQIRPQIAHRSHKPNTPDYHNPAQHNAPVDPGGNPIKRSPSNKHLFPTHREIDRGNKGYWNTPEENYTPDGMLISSTPEFYKKEGIGNIFDRWMDMSKGKKLTDEERKLWHKIGVKLHGV